MVGPKGTILLFGIPQWLEMAISVTICKRDFVIDIGIYKKIKTISKIMSGKEQIPGHS